MDIGDFLFFFISSLMILIGFIGLLATLKG
jgi:hypothetical protein